MRVILLILILAIINLQYAESRVNFKNEEWLQSLARQHDDRAIKDIWTTIKNSAKNAWNSIKKIAQNTEDKIKQWINHVKDRANDLSRKFEERIISLRQKSKALLEKLVGTGQLVKECFQKENEAIEKLLKQIIKYVTTCVSDSLLTLTHVNNHKLNFFNETIFLSEVENKMNECIMQKDMEECLYSVRQDIYFAMESIENEVLTAKTEVRGISDNILDAVMNCSVEGLIDASNIIATESIEIITCVVQG